MATGQRLLAELKARCGDLTAVLERLRRRGTHEATLRQADTYFVVPRGRLKLREVEGRPAQLIYYERPDVADVKSSQVCLANVEDGTAIRTLLIAALRVRARVVKRREIWRCEGVQVHLDTVDRLGTFIEFEEPVEGTGLLDAAVQHLRRLRVDFGIGDDDLLDCSYGEL